MDIKKEEERCIQAFENKCSRKLLEHRWDVEDDSEQVYKLAYMREGLMSRIEYQKLRYIVHVMRNLLQVSIEGRAMTSRV